MENHINVAINAIKVLRTNVGQVFESLGNGIRVADNEDENNKEQLQYIQELLHSVNVNLR